MEMISITRPYFCKRSVLAPPPAFIPKAFIASKAGLRDLKLPILEEKYDSIKGVLKSQLADGKKVSVKLKATEGGTT